MAICTSEQVMRNLGRADNIKDETEIKRLITAVQAVFERYCNRLFDEAIYTEYYSGDGTDKLFVKNGPIYSVTTIHDDTDHAYGADTLVAATEYGTINDIYVQMYTSRFAVGVNNIKIIYVAGYGDNLAVPANLEHAGIEQAAWLFKKGEQHLYGISGKTLEDGSLQMFDTGLLLPSVKAILDSYRRINVG